MCMCVHVHVCEYRYKHATVCVWSKDNWMLVFAFCLKSGSLLVHCYCNRQAGLWACMDAVVSTSHLTTWGLGLQTCATNIWLSVGIWTLVLTPGWQGAYPLSDLQSPMNSFLYYLDVFHHAMLTYYIHLKRLSYQPLKISKCTLRVKQT